MTIFYQGTFSQGSEEWKKATEGITITAYDPPLSGSQAESEFVEPGRAINLPAVERARMNRAKRGVEAPAELR